jgi:hypothetical protein
VLNRRDLIKLGLYGGTAGMLHLTRLVGPLLFGFGRKDECNGKST